MTSNLGMRRSADGVRDLVRAYDGEVPVPFYWQAAPTLRRPSRHHPGEIETVLPYATLPIGVAFTPSISLDQIEELAERRARREELGGG